jgi:hypothetical protein
MIDQEKVLPFIYRIAAIEFITFIFILQKYNFDSKKSTEVILDSPELMALTLAIAAALSFAWSIID